MWEKHTVYLTLFKIIKLGNRLIIVYDVLAFFSFTLRLPVTVYALLDSSTPIFGLFLLVPSQHKWTMSPIKGTKEQEIYRGDPPITVICKQTLWASPEENVTSQKSSTALYRGRTAFLLMPFGITSNYL